MKGINYNRLKRFDIGTRPTNPGYQTNTSVVDTSSFASNSGYDMSGDVQVQQNKWMPTVLSGVQNLGNVAMNVAKNYTTESAAAAAGTKAGMNAVGKAASIVGSLYGTGSMIKDFVDFSDRLKGADMQNMSAESIQSKNGISYKTYDGFNQKQVDDYTNAQNKAGVWSSTLNGLSAGASFGSMFSYLGTAIGGIAGGLTGLVGGLIGGGRRKRKIEESKNNVLGTQSGYNAQAESEAGSQGLRNLFYEGRADKGKAPGQMLGGSQYGMIQTPSGPTYGKIEGLASPDEGQIDMATGETQYNGSKYMNVRDRRADVIPVGITGYANGGAFNNNVGIPGHQMDINGLTFADNARPLFKKNEQLKDASAAIDAQIEENNNHKTRDKATSRYIANKLGKMKDQIQQQYQQNSQEIANIVNRQTQALNGNMFNCGKTPRFYGGWSPEQIKLTQPNTLWRFQKNNPLEFSDMRFKAPTMEDMRKEIFKGPVSVPKYDLDFVKDAKPIKLGGIPEPDDVVLEFEKPKTDTQTTGPGDIFNSVFGVTDAGVGPGWSVLQGLPYAIGESIAANKETPYAQNSFVPNMTAPAALNVMRSLRYDPTNQLNQLRTASRQSLYNINNAGSLSAGQRAALASSNNIAAAQAANSIYDKSQEVNNAYRAQYADAMMKYGQDEASRLQQANAYQQEAYRQAVGAKQKLQAQARKNWYTLGRQALQDYNTMLNTRGMMNLWNAQLAGNSNTSGTSENQQTTTPKTIKKLRQKPVASKNDMTALPGETVADTLRKNNRMSYAQVAKIAAKKNISPNSAWRHYMKYGNLNNL